MTISLLYSTLVSGSGLYGMIWGPVQSGLSFSVHFKEAVRCLYDDMCLFMVCVCVCRTSMEGRGPLG